MENEEKISNENLAKHFFYSRCFEDAYSHFEMAQMPYEMGLCKLLIKDLDAAKKIWENIANPCCATKWGLTVLELINLKSTRTPGFFQIRAFLEVYLNLFLENDLFEYAENLISAYAILAKQNYESCKFIARALFSHGYTNATLDFIKKSKQICYPDPEGLLIEAQCYVKMSERNENEIFDSGANATKGRSPYFSKDFYDLAQESLDEVLAIVPEYTPALRLREEISRRL